MKLSWCGRNEALKNVKDAIHPAELLAHHEDFFAVSFKKISINVLVKNELPEKH